MNKVDPCHSRVIMNEQNEVHTRVLIGPYTSIHISSNNLFARHAFFEGND